MSKSSHIVKIDETSCIGCMKCIPVCPVDAIVGAAKQLHVVVTEYCIGCDLCLPPCPVNCIEVVTIEPLSQEMRRKQAKMTKERHLHQKIRGERMHHEKTEADKAALADMQSILAMAMNKKNKQTPLL